VKEIDSPIKLGAEKSTPQKKGPKKCAKGSVAHFGSYVDYKYAQYRSIHAETAVQMTASYM
jgi:hypothetical protein